MSYYSSFRILREESPRGVWIIGHRGAKGYAPENTMVGFDIAVRMGVDMIECDVHLSKDGECMVFHDQNLQRTSNGRGLLRNSTAKKLKKLDAGSWFSQVYAGQKIPTLGELLEWSRKKNTILKLPLVVIIEIKSERVKDFEIADKVLETIKKTRMLERTVVISKDPRVILRMRQIQPSILSGIVQERAVADPVKLARQSKVRILMPHHKLVGISYIRMTHKKHYTVVPWPVDNRFDVMRLLQMNVDAVSTNYPEMVSQMLNIKHDVRVWDRLKLGDNWGLGKQQKKLLKSAMKRMTREQRKRIL